MNTGEIQRSKPTAHPVSPRDRIDIIDSLRGLALFGVLAVNLDTQFRRTLLEQFLPPPPMHLIDQAAWLLLAYALDFKAISLFSLLFGVGLAMQFERLAANGLNAGWLLRRLLVLLAFGLIHLLFIWNGDILTEYALAGVLALPFLRIRANASIAAAVLLLALFAATPMLNLGDVIPPQQQMLAHIEHARTIYGNTSLLAIMRLRISELSLVLPLLANVFPRTLALILLGSALWRMGAIKRVGANPRPTTIAGVILIAFGFVLTAQVRGDLAFLAPDSAAALLVSASAPLVVAAGYACLILAASHARLSRRLVGWAAPVGRMAFSNYIAQSLILTALFYGVGVGLMGRIGPAEGLVISILMLAAQSIVSAWWLRTHRFGPLEWLWRALTYGSRPDWLVSRIR